MEKFRNREVSKPRSFETETSHSAPRGRLPCSRPSINHTPPCIRPSIIPTISTPGTGCHPPLSYQLILPHCLHQVKCWTFFILPDTKPGANSCAPCSPFFFDRFDLFQPAVTSRSQSHCAELEASMQRSTALRPGSSSSHLGISFLLLRCTGDHLLSQQGKRLAGLKLGRWRCRTRGLLLNNCEIDRLTVDIVCWAVGRQGSSETDRG